MTNQEILTKAIQKAIDGGFDKYTELMYDDTTGLLYRSKRNDAASLALEQLIFNHDFAKALWGDMYKTNLPTAPNWVDHFDPAKINKPAWQYHLQQMVIADDPIQYLGENI